MALGVHLPSGTALLALIPLAALMLGLIGYALVHLVRADAAPYLPKWGWALIIIMVSLWGPLVYLLLARARRHLAPAGPVPVAGTAVLSTSPTPVAQVQVPVAPQAPVASGAILMRTHGLSRDYGGGAGLFDVDLAVPQGAVYGLVGPNGAGKTTLLSILSGTRHATRGSVELDMPRGAVAVCPDVPEFEPWLTAFEVVDLARRYVAPHLGSDSVLGVLHIAGLSDQVDRRVGGFSRGMTQRLGLAVALVGDPALLMLDEPTSALDPAGRAEMLDLVAAMRGRRTVIFSSHILADVQRVADHVGVLRAGRLLYQGSTRSLVDDHLDPRWVIRLRSPVSDVVRMLQAQSWVRRAEPIDDESLRVDADTLDHGEAEIAGVLASCNARLVSCEPVAADLEAAFLALTAQEVRS
jgi:ABC-2 type transport system ATP-binding protein